MLARKFESYRLHIAGITQNKQKCLIFTVVSQGRKIVSQIRSKWRKEIKKKEEKKLTWKNKYIHTSDIKNDNFSKKFTLPSYFK